MEKVSVIIPTYNRAHLIERSVRSVLEQTYRDIEVIVVDDGSLDDTESVIQGIEDERIVYYKQPVNAGVSAARNKGAKLAIGKWIAFQDSDDYWREDKLQTQLEYAGEHPGYKLIYCAYLCHLPDGRTVPMPQSDMYNLEGELFEALLLRNAIGAPTILVDKEEFIKSGGFDAELKSLEDWEFVLRFSEKHAIGYVNKILVDAYLSDGGVSSGKGAYFETRCRMIARYYKELSECGGLEATVTDLLGRANSCGVSDQVKNMLLSSLRNCRK